MVPQKRAAKIGPFIMVASLMICVIAVLLVPLMTAGATQPASSQAEAVQPANAVSYNTVEEGMAALNLRAAYPTALPEGHLVTDVLVLDGKVLEVRMLYGKYDIVYRTAKGNEDVSGQDYGAYPYTITEAVGDVSRGYAGVSEKKLELAVWANGDYSYSVFVPGGTEPELLKQIAESIA